MHIKNRELESPNTSASISIGSVSFSNFPPLSQNISKLVMETKIEIIIRPINAAGFRVRATEFLYIS